jgi:glycosyltransferase involved in cell wall biosynthesis
MESKRALEARGHAVEFYNPWAPNLNSYDVIHFFSVFNGSSVFCNAVRTAGLPLVISPILWPQPEHLGVPEIHALLKMADVLCPNSVAEAELLARSYDLPVSKMSVTYNGINEHFFSTARIGGELFRSTYGIQGDFVLCVANIEVRKNQVRLLEACRRLHLPLILVGNVRDSEYFKKLKEDSRGWTYLGYIEPGSELLISAMKACSVFALPSLLETPGLAALEAMAVGARVLITREGPTREYFGDTAVYCDPLSSASIEEGLRKSKQHESEGNSRDEWDAQKYAWSQTAAQLETAYQRALTIHGDKR